MDTMRIASWNLNHKTRLKDVPIDAVEGLVSLNPDVIVLTEYVHGPSRTEFLDRLASHGFHHWLVSHSVPGENQVLIASRTNLERGPILAPAIAPSVPSNALDAFLPLQGYGILGIRVPDYSKNLKVKRECWDWILSTAQSVRTTRSS